MEGYILNMEHKLGWGIFLILVIVIIIYSYWLFTPWSPRQPPDERARMIQEAELELSRIFQESNTNFAIWPPDANPYSVAGGTRIAVVAGIRNAAEDNQTHKYSIDIKWIQGPEDPTSWITYDTTSKMVSYGNNIKTPAIISTPETAILGIHTFRITACTDQNTPAGESDSCPAETPNVLQAPKNFVLQIQD